MPKIGTFLTRSKAQLLILRLSIENCVAWGHCPFSNQRLKSSLSPPAPLYQQGCTPAAVLPAETSQPHSSLEKCPGPSHPETPGQLLHFLPGPHPAWPWLLTRCYKALPLSPATAHSAVQSTAAFCRGADSLETALPLPIHRLYLSPHSRWALPQILLAPSGPSPSHMHPSPPRALL